MPTNIADVQEFLAQRRIALIGVSRDPKEFSRYVFREMCARGYDMVAVNPAASEIEGRRCFARVQDVTPPVEAALIMTRPADTETVVSECAQAGVRRVWMHRGGGQGSVSAAAVAFCRSNGISVVEGHCPLMFLAHTPFFHHLHGFVLKVLGRYPAAAARA